MAIQTLNNGETGLEFRTKLNDNFSEVLSIDPTNGLQIDGTTPSVSQREQLRNGSAINKVSRWLSGKSGVLPVPEMMDPPPTVTITSSPTVNGLSSGSVSHAWNSGFLDFGVDSFTEYSAGIATSQVITNSVGAKLGARVSRMRFLTDAPAFEFATAYSQFVDLNIVVDGKLGFSNSPAILPTSAGNRYVKFDFGADAQGFAIIQGQTPSAAGTGYVSGDEITLAGGTGTPAVLVVIGTGGGGAVASVKVKNPGNYSVKPTGAISQASTTGVGTGFQITSVVWGSTHTTRKMRAVEIYFNSACRIRGLNVDVNSVVLPWPVPSHLPRLIICGDSQTAGTYLTDAFGHMGTRIAHKLGLGDSYAINAQGGTGWNTDNSTNLRWSSSTRIADLVALQGDIYLFIGSQNDTQNAALQTAIQNGLASLRSQRPHAYIIGIGSVMSTGSAFTKAAFESSAALYGQIAYIDNVATPWLTGSGNINAPTGSGNRDFYVSSDVNHLNHSGVDFFADLSAHTVLSKLSDLAI